MEEKKLTSITVLRETEAWRTHHMNLCILDQIVVCRDIIDSWLWTKSLIRGQLRGRYSYSCLQMVALIVSSMSQVGWDCTSNQVVNSIFWLKLLALKGALHQYVREFPAQGAAVASEKMIRVVCLRETIYEFC